MPRSDSESLDCEHLVSTSRDRSMRTASARARVGVLLQMTLSNERSSARAGAQQLPEFSDYGSPPGTGVQQPEVRRCPADRARSTPPACTVPACAPRIPIAPAPPTESAPSPATAIIIVVSIIMTPSFRSDQPHPRINADRAGIACRDSVRCDPVRITTRQTTPDGSTAQGIP